MMKTQARRGTGIEAIVAGMNPQKVEEQTVIAPCSSTVEQALQLYQQFLVNPKYHEIRPDGEKEFNLRSLQYVQTVLAPEELDCFLQGSIRYEDQEYASDVLSPLVTKLLENSYRHNFNDFYLNCGLVKSTDHYFMALTGKEEKPLRLTVNGPLGQEVANCMHHVALHVKGDVGYDFGSSADDCTIQVDGLLGEDSARDSNNTTYILEKITARSIFNEKEPSDSTSSSPRNCIFKTGKRQTLQTLLSTVPEGNRVILIDKTGKEAMQRDYYDAPH